MKAKRALVIGLIVAGWPAMGQSVPIRVEPAHQEVAIGDTFSIAITIEGVSDLKGVDIRLSYEPNKVKAISIEKGTEIHSFTEYINTFDNIGGNLEYMAVLSDTGAGVNIDSGSIFIIDFIALSETDSTPFTFDSIIAPIGNSESAVIPFTFNDGGVRIGQVGFETDQIPIPSILTLQNIPNPFTSSTVIRYGIPEDSYVTLNIYNVAGRLVKSLVAGHKKAGYHSFEWKDRYISSGIYFCRLTTEQGYYVRKLIKLTTQ